MTDSEAHRRVVEVATRCYGALARGLRTRSAKGAHEGVVSILLSMAVLEWARERERAPRALSRAWTEARRDPTTERLRAALALAHETLDIGLFRRAARGPAVRVDAASTVTRWLGEAAKDTEAERLGTLYEALSTLTLDASLEVTPSLARKRSGSHYTPRALADAVAGRALAPLLRNASPKEVVALRVCDASSGGGAFLLAAIRALASALAEAGARDPERKAAEACVRGVDVDPIAIDLSRAAIWLETGAIVGSSHFACGDATDDRALDWARAFPDVMARRGFDAFVGNPPWISYVGRATQPISRDRKLRLKKCYASFSGYLNLQGVFIERCATLLAPGGRLGLLVPSSMSEQSGYAATRLAHDRMCVADRDLPDFGDSFEGVFQPCMALVSTKLAEPREPPQGPWPVERPDLDAAARAIVAKMDRRPLPAHLFGERGLQSVARDKPHLRSERSATYTVALRTGSDVRPFHLGPPSLYADRAWFGSRIRGEDEFRRVAVVLRQTARVPMAALSDGHAFRNSLLAAFADEDHPAAFLVAYLNSSPIRYMHYARFRDARQGMPQVKIGHLRAVPELDDPRAKRSLEVIGARLSRANAGISPGDQAEIDRTVADAFGLDAGERALIEAWAAALK